MRHNRHSSPIPAIRSRVHELRERFGPQPWLTVVSGVTAEAYRLAKLPPTEFADLLEAQMGERGRLLIHLRRKPIMRLRAGFDGADGGIADDNGMAFLNLHFPGGSYTEKVWDEPAPTLSVASPRTSLLVTGGYSRPVSELAGKLPRCLGARSIRGGEVSRSAWGGKAEVVVHPHWETLALMPDNISDALGMERQRSLDQMPWLEVATPVREDAPRTVRQAAPAAARQAPGLRLVASS
ncbi:MAG: hypothetical protein V4472_17485 [Pseudomonadota bacterium]